MAASAPLSPHPLAPHPTEGESFAREVREKGAPLFRSDAAHVVPTRYYLDFCIPINEADSFGGKRKFMEESMHYRMQARVAVTAALHARAREAPASHAL